MDAFGLNIYEHDDQLSPKITFPWGEIRNVEYHGKKVGVIPFSMSTLYPFYFVVRYDDSSVQFCIMPSDKKSPNFIFYVSKTRISDLVSRHVRHA